MDEGDSLWSRKGATLSDKSARQEFGLTEEEVIAAIRAGKLQFRECSMHGNPWFRLLRHEVEALVRDKSGVDSLHKKVYHLANPALVEAFAARKVRIKAMQGENDVLSITSVEPQ